MRIKFPKFPRLKFEIPDIPDIPDIEIPDTITKQQGEEIIRQLKEMNETLKRILNHVHGG